MRFQPGQSGNPGGRKKEKPWTDALRIAVNREDAQGRRKLQLLAEKAVEMALEGDLAAMKEIGDRLEGKSVQGIEHSDPEDRTIIIYGGFKNAINRQNGG